MVDRRQQLVRLLIGRSDPLERLIVADEYAQELRVILRELAIEAHDAGRTWDDIGGALGVSRAAAHVLGTDRGRQVGLGLGEPLLAQVAHGAGAHGVLPVFDLAEHPTERDLGLASLAADRLGDVLLLARHGVLADEGADLPRLLPTLADRPGHARHHRAPDGQGWRSRWATPFADPSRPA